MLRNIKEEWLADKFREYAETKLLYSSQKAGEAKSTIKAYITYLKSQRNDQWHKHLRDTADITTFINSTYKAPRTRQEKQSHLDNFSSFLASNEGKFIWIRSHPYFLRVVTIGTIIATVVTLLITLSGLGQFFGQKPDWIIAYIFPSATPTYSPTPSPTVTPTPTITLAPTNTPVGGRTGSIVFSSNRDGNWEIYSMNPDGTDPRNLTHDSAIDELPSLSLDGQKVSFLSWRSGTPNIYRMDIDGNNVIRLSTTVFPQIDGWSSWLNNDTQIGFYSNRDGSGEIYTIDADGANPNRVTSNDLDESYPKWSPNGAFLAFSISELGSTNLYIMDLATGEYRRVANSAYQPSWSPDGSRITFTKLTSQGGTIYSMAVDGTDPQQLTQGTPDSQPDYSPDGKYIVFVSSRDGNGEIYVMNADGTNERRLTVTSAENVDPAW